MKEELNQFEKGMMRFLLTFSRPELRNMAYWIRRDLNTRLTNMHTDYNNPKHMEKAFSQHFHLCEDHGLRDGFGALLGMSAINILPYGEDSSEDEDSDSYNYQCNP